MSRFGFGLMIAIACGMVAAPVAKAGVIKALVAKHYETHESLYAKLKHKHTVNGGGPVKQCIKSHHGGGNGQNCQ